MFNLLDADPPVITTSDNDGLNPFFVALIIILILIVIIACVVAFFNADKNKTQSPAYLTSEEIAYIKAYRQTQGKNSNKEISFETLDEGELRLLQEYRKNLTDNTTQK